MTSSVVRLPVGRWWGTRRVASCLGDTSRLPRSSTPVPAAQWHTPLTVLTARALRGSRHPARACPGDTNCRRRKPSPTPAAQSCTQSSARAARGSPARRRAGACPGDTSCRRHRPIPTPAEQSYTPPPTTRASPVVRCRAGACLADTSRQPRRSTLVRAEPSYIHFPVPRRRPSGAPRGWDLQLRLPRAWLRRGSSSSSSVFLLAVFCQVKRKNTRRRFFRQVRARSARSSEEASVRGRTSRERQRGAAAALLHVLARGCDEPNQPGTEHKNSRLNHTCSSI